MRDAGPNMASESAASVWHGLTIAIEQCDDAGENADGLTVDDQTVDGSR